MKPRKKQKPIFTRSSLRTSSEPIEPVEPSPPSRKWPAWKLQSYLKTIDDTLTTPLGSAVRGSDFPPETRPGTNSRLPTDMAEMYKRQTEGVQQGNKILPP